MSESSASNEWNGEVVSNTDDGRIRGCSLTRVENQATEWIVSIDGQEADLGKFSEAIYRKITADAKRQNFQGFRPGTIPPHLIPTYSGFAMDECAREAVLEAMQQNNIRPFDETRNEFEFESISIMPVKKKGKKKKKGKRKKGNNNAEVVAAAPAPVEPEEVWKQYDSMKEAISAGWKPGQTFSFVATNVKGQELKDQDVTGAKRLGAGGSALDLNTIAFED
jgi:hypothetical protein